MSFEVNGRGCWKPSGYIPCPIGTGRDLNALLFTGTTWNNRNHPQHANTRLNNKGGLCRVESRESLKSYIVLHKILMTKLCLIAGVLWGITSLPFGTFTKSLVSTAGLWGKVPLQLVVLGDGFHIVKIQEDRAIAQPVGMCQQSFAPFAC
jgi:hypothetical protein